MWPTGISSGVSVLPTHLCHLCLQLLPSHEAPKVVQSHLGLPLPDTEPSPPEALTPPIGEWYGQTKVSPWILGVTAPRPAQQTGLVSKSITFQSRRFLFSCLSDEFAALVRGFGTMLNSSGEQWFSAQSVLPQQEGILENSRDISGWDKRVVEGEGWLDMTGVQCTEAWEPVKPLIVTGQPNRENHLAQISVMLRLRKTFILYLDHDANYTPKTWGKEQTESY